MGGVQIHLALFVLCCLVAALTAPASSPPLLVSSSDAGAGPSGVLSSAVPMDDFQSHVNEMEMSDLGGGGVGNPVFVCYFVSRVGVGVGRVVVWAMAFERGGWLLFFVFVFFVILLFFLDMIAFVAVTCL